MSNEIQEALERALPAIAIRIETELIRTAPVDGSRLKVSIKVFSTKNGLLISMAKHGEYVEFGSRPHIIKAKKGKMLHWHKKKGRTQHSHPHSPAMKADAIYAKEVRIPRIRPNPFIRNALQLKLPKIIIEELNRQLKA